MAETETFFERLARTSPRLSAKYLAHLATQINDAGSQDSAASQIFDARIARRYAQNEADSVLAESRLEIATARDTDLRARFMLFATPFFDANLVPEEYAGDSQARDILDVVYDEQVKANGLKSQW